MVVRPARRLFEVGGMVMRGWRQYAEKTRSNICTSSEAICGVEESIGMRAAYEVCEQHGER